MNAILLCAGFATRMYPLTRDFPKPLLTVAGRPVIDYLVEQILDLQGIHALHVVTNDRFNEHFLEWRKDRERIGIFKDTAVHIHNDGSTANENRLGASADLLFAMRRITDHGRLLVSGGDNIYLFPLKPLWNVFMEGSDHYVPAVQENDTEKLRRTGVMELEGEVLTRLHEKPEKPPSNWTCPPLYCFQPTARSALEEFIAAQESHDAPGYFIDFLCRRETVKVCRVEGGRLDIGSVELYHDADRKLRTHGRHGVRPGHAKE